MMSRGSVLAVASIGAGLVLAAVAARALSTFPYGIGPFDSVAWGSAILMTMSVAVLANALPAIRPARIGPMTALRAE